MKKKSLSLLLALAMILSMVLSLPVTAFGQPVTAYDYLAETPLEDAIAETAAYVLKTVKNPQVGTIGGEWAVLGLARSGYQVPADYYQKYYETVEKYVRDCGGKLHSVKYTEYSRVILALSAIGADARNVAGYDLTAALGDYDKTIRQGVNGAIWALIALDSRDYPIPQNGEAKTQAARQMYIDYILSCQMKDGGWNLLKNGKTEVADTVLSDPDITGMALQALSRYQDQPAVVKATEEALACMSSIQHADGSFSQDGAACSSEGSAQMLVALTSLGISLDDARFTKNGKTVLDGLMTFYEQDGSFHHMKGGDGDSQMATEQGLYALAAARRARGGQNSLYRMSDVSAAAFGGNGQSGQAGQNGQAQELPQGLPGKNEAVKARPVTAQGAAFSDVTEAVNGKAIEALAARGIISGKGGGKFDPEAKMTRAEFTAIVVNALGLSPKATRKFSDVPEKEWYAPYIGTANSFGIVNGVGGGRFNPEGTITHQEAAVMVSQAAALCGMENKIEAAEAKTALSGFPDFAKAESWAYPGLAFCYQNGILDSSETEIQAVTAIKRCEIAQMVYNLLTKAELI